VSCVLDAGFIEKLQSVPQIRDVASDQQIKDCSHTDYLATRLPLVFCRLTSTTRSTTPWPAAGIDIFTQLNQYHVVMEVDPQFQQDPNALKNIYVHS